VEVAHLYKITNKLTGDYYVGKHNGWEQNGYWGSGLRIKSSVEKYGKENFNYEILCYGSPEFILKLEEKYVTLELIESDEKCLNLMVGGYGSSRTTKETRKKLSLVSSGKNNAMYGKKHTEATRQKITSALLGKPLKEETKNKLSQITAERIWINDGVANKRIILSELENYKKKGFFRGRAPLTNEHRKNIGKAVMGRKRKPESIMKMKKTIQLKKEKING
jgi:hypothetical protein